MGVRDGGMADEPSAVGHTRRHIGDSSPGSVPGLLVYLVPFGEDEHTVFLKTIIPSRKATTQCLGEEFNDEDGR
jgi:hypothetical protein